MMGATGRCSAMNWAVAPDSVNVMMELESVAAAADSAAAQVAYWDETGPRRVFARRRTPGSVVSSAARMI